MRTGWGAVNRGGARTVSTVQLSGDRAVRVVRQEAGLVVGIGDAVHGPYSSLGTAVVFGDGSVCYWANADGRKALFVDGAVQAGRYDLVSNPVETGKGRVVHGFDRSMKRIEF